MPAYTFGFLEGLSAFHFNAGLPVYVIVYTHDILANGVPTPTAEVTLSAAALKAKCSVALTISDRSSHFGGAPEFTKVYVLKVPHFSSGELFTLRLSGTQVPTSDPPTGQFCGHYESHETLVRSGTLPGSDLPQWTYTWSSTTPDGTTSGTNTLYGADPIPGYNNHPHDVVRDSASYYDSLGRLVDTGLSCGTPLFKLQNFPFDVNISCNPITGHTVQNPGWPFDPADVVRTPAHFGNKTRVWEIDLGTNVQDNNLTFSIRNSLLCTPAVRPTKDKIIEVYPSNLVPGFRYDYFGRPNFRLNKPLPAGTDNPISAAWDPIGRLYAGNPPPTLTYDPVP